MKYILRKAGGADHSTKEYALFRSRNHAWIVEGKHFAKNLVIPYQWCKMMTRVQLEKIMGMLPEEKLMEPCVPLTHITVDLKGPFQVKDTIKKRIGSLVLHKHKNSPNGRGKYVHH